MSSETLTQILVLVWVNIMGYFGARTVIKQRKKPSGNNGGGILDTASKVAGALMQGDDGESSTDREDKIINGWLTITDILQETRAELTATRIERDAMRGELAESKAARADDAKRRDELADQVTLLRADVTRLQHEANEREENHRVELARSRAEIAELTETNERQRETIIQLQEYVHQLLPLLKCAGIATDELPVLPPPIENGNGKTTTAERPKVEGD